ncbi:EAL domain-containing protein [Sphingomonas sp. PL-96]|uniref:putative bifunctional diguanylate cyclase/phosphodiesterase n=1 Tax=Sphingomonas sp. PL-96 TaxID=2887201 RepID=UPI001E5B6045|nr:EAL domain-containing protein [Sphingomonas sp. PL-96]MCC2976624.1 EAL domain-containing protein [Sphingomonas sp. PL-96]
MVGSLIPELDISTHTEAKRLAALADYGVLDGTADAEFDTIVELAVSLFGVSGAMVSFVARDEQVFAARRGVEACRTPRSMSFCAHALDGHDVMVVEDALLDVRFADNPLVQGPPNIRFYAGAPLRVASGDALGTLCLIHDEPRTLNDRDRGLLRTLAGIVVERLELWRSKQRHEASERRLTRLAHTDGLTGLPNRVQFHSQAQEVLSDREAAALLLFDLDGFKDVNDVFGHATGDRLLLAVGERLQSLLEDQHLLARLGGDEFVILLRGVGDARSAYKVAERIHLSFREGFDIDGQQLQLETCIGLAVAPYHGETIDTLLRHADLALYRAKDEGGGSVGYFEPHLRHDVETRRSMQTELHRAFERGEFELHYQPQVTLSDGKLTGMEALLRWQHPERGLLPPSEFLATLELMPLSARVGEWVLRTAVQQAAAWAASGTPLVVAVNLSAAQFLSGYLPDTVAAELRRWKLPPKLLELEMTERVAVKNTQSSAAILRAVRALGVGIALDDFGTGYASLSLLRDLPVSRLKIDRSFTKDAQPGNHDAALIDAIVRLSHAFNLGVVAEGIETAEQSQFLAEMGCVEGQGYLYGRPMCARDLDTLIAGARA